MDTQHDGLQNVQYLLLDMAIIGSYVKFLGCRIGFKNMRNILGRLEMREINACFENLLLGGSYPAGCIELNFLRIQCG